MFVLHGGESKFPAGSSGANSEQTLIPRSGAEGRRPTRSVSRSPRSASVPARRYPAAATVRPAPPIRAVDLPSLLARRPAGRAAVTAVTMVLEAPLAGRHLAATLHKPIGICLLRDKCVVVASTFENKVKMFTGCGQFLREVAAEPGRGFRHPSDMTALAGGGFAVRDQVRRRGASAGAPLLCRWPSGATSNAASSSGASTPPTWTGS